MFVPRTYSPLPLLKCLTVVIGKSWLKNTLTIPSNHTPSMSKHDMWHHFKIIWNVLNVCDWLLDGKPVKTGLK